MRAVLEHVVGAANAARFAVFAGDVVPAKKPDPGIYLLALAELDVARSDALVVEDSRNGLLAADGAGLRCVVTLDERDVYVVYWLSRIACSHPDRETVVRHTSNRPDSSDT